jgi:U6 snRNA-associated Sm-like protein LSm1
MTIRGENVTICATVDLDREDNPKGLKFVEEEVVRRLAAEQKIQRKESEERRARALRQAGVELSIGMHA